MKPTKMSTKLNPSLSLFLCSVTHSSTPVVCLVIEGGTNTIRAVLEYVTDSPPVPGIEIMFYKKHKYSFLKKSNNR